MGEGGTGRKGRESGGIDRCWNSNINVKGRFIFSKFTTEAIYSTLQQKKIFCQRKIVLNGIKGGLVVQLPEPLCHKI